MKYLINVLVVLLICLIGHAQQYPPIVYNKTNLIYYETMNSTKTDTIPYIYIGSATDFRLLWTSEDSVDFVISYQLKNSQTGAVTSLTAIDSAVTTKSNGSKGIMTAVALSSFVGYDQVMFSIAQSGDALGGTTAGKYVKLYLYPVRRAGGFLGDSQNRKQKTNTVHKFYYLSGYTASTANDTIPNFIPINGTTDLRVFVNTNDSLVADIYYILNNSVIDSTTAGSKLGATVTHVQPLTDTTTTPGSLPLSTLIGYDGIKFYIDYKANSTAATGAGGICKMYYYLLRRE